MTLLLVYILSAILFLLIMLSLGFQPRILSRLTGALLLFVAAAGTVFYGYAYSVLFGNVPQAVMRTLFSVFCMFLGRNEISTISAVPALASPAMQCFIYTVHLLALYCTASAVIAAMGTRLMRMLHLLFMRRGDLHLIYGAGEDSVAFGRELLGKNSGVLLFVDKSDALDAAILRMGSLLFTDADALAPNAAFLQKIGMNSARRRLSVYCLGEDCGDNLRYAASMAAALEELGHDAAFTSLTVLTDEESQGAALQAEDRRCGYGSVLAVSRRDLAARLMLRSVPPWETMRFDGKGRAEEDFEALIVGFGRTGQAVLRALVMNGQFAGSQFRATVIARDTDEYLGDFDVRSPELTETYHIRFINGNAHSAQVYQALADSAANLNYVAFCTGSDEENEELADEYDRFLSRLGCRAPLMLCTASSVRRHISGSAAEGFSLFSPEILCSQKMDDMAILLNHQYHAAEGRTKEEDWARCDYFSRMSCRASADFLPAVLKAAGLDPEDAAREDFAFPSDTLENLAETEHMRWCAFHRVMGYRTMPEELFRRRAEEAGRERAETGQSALRPAKDTAKLLHACLVPWDDLDALSSLEYELSGREVDYKDLDRDNLRIIPAMLRAEDRHE